MGKNPLSCLQETLCSFLIFDWWSWFTILGRDCFLSGFLVNFPRDPSFFRGCLTATRVLQPLPFHCHRCPTWSLFLSHLGNCQAYNPAAPCHLPTIEDLPNHGGEGGRWVVGTGLSTEDPLPVSHTYPAPHPTGTAGPWPSCCRSWPLQCCRPLRRAGAPAEQHEDRETVSPHLTSSIGS